MYGVLKLAFFGAALLTGMALAAQAQSASASPPGDGVLKQSVQPHPFGPKPGGAKSWKQQRYQAPADCATNPAYHPYSMHGKGPQIDDAPWFGSAPQSVAHPASSGIIQGL
jgi:hypothetical protein